MGHKNILIIGAGRSSTACINYCLQHAEIENWSITLADANLDLAKQRINGHARGQAVALDVTNADNRFQLIEKNDIVVSLLPAFLHYLVAQDCITLKKHLVTASYVSDEIKALDEKAKAAGLIFMGEMGLDPGIDHMSAMQLLHEIREKGGTITAFRSYAGGLIAPESDNNPWHYKFTWNPRNVVLAGQGTAQYLEDGKYKYKPYVRLFGEHEVIDVPGMGKYEAYPNRDSLKYREIYEVEDIPNMLRATLRCVGYCSAWDALIKLGLTDDSYKINGSETMTYASLVHAFLPKTEGSIIERTAQFLGEAIDSDIMSKLIWLGLFEDTKIGKSDASPAQILEHLLLQKWTLDPEDKDMIVMQHEIEYELNGKQKKVISNMVMKGNNQKDTAMARLVGLPMAILVKLIAQDKVNIRGVHIPVMSEIYNPVLAELETFGVVFNETVIEL